LTVRLKVVLWVSEPEVPVTVTVAGPVVAEAEAVRVKVELALPLPGGVTGFAEKEAVTPLGSPDALRLVAELNPPWLETVMVLVPLPPWVTVTEGGEAATVKSGAPAPTAKIRSSASS
jgi:hypothetical protein